MLNLMHIGLHNRINQNAGDTMLFDATRQCFKHFLGPIHWTLEQLWEPFSADIGNRFDGIVVGGGGLLLPDQEGASYEASGWQWNCSIEQLEAIKVPLIVFAIGYNRFRGQEGFSELYNHHITRTAFHADFFGLRENISFDGLLQGIEGSFITQYQPCPTTCISQLYGINRQPNSRIKNIGINVATDRAGYRFGPGDEARVFDGLAAFCKEAEQRDIAITVLCHKEQDAAIVPALANRRVMYHLVDLSDAEPQHILHAYSHLDLVIGMRGHAQLIPFGMRIPIISIISHDKLKWFLEDIGHPEWGIEVGDPYFNTKLESLAHLAKYDLVDNKSLESIQQKCWQITQKNMLHIAQILGVEAAV